MSANSFFPLWSNDQLPTTDEEWQNEVRGFIEKYEFLCVGAWDGAFLQFAWLIKVYNENTRDNQKKYFNERLCGARIVTANAYSMLKGRWRILFKKTECQLFHLRYIVIACIILHNLCIEILVLAK